MIAVSGCLIGINCRYDGGSQRNEELLKRLENEDYIAICPEVDGGMSTPRSPSEIVGGDGYDVLEGKAKVISKVGEDVTRPFIDGAKKALETCLKHGIKVVYLKENSPSCGANCIYNGTFQGKIVPGIGVCAALLKKNGIEVIAV